MGNIELSRVSASLVEDSYIVSESWKLAWKGDRGNTRCYFGFKCIKIYVSGIAYTPLKPGEDLGTYNGNVTNPLNTIAIGVY